MKKKSYGLKTLFYLSLIFFLLAPVVTAQTIEYGKTTGTVVDEEGAPLPG
jgi:hypothetical protein